MPDRRRQTVASIRKKYKSSEVMPSAVALNSLRDTLMTAVDQQCHKTLPRSLFVVPTSGFDWLCAFIIVRLHRRHLVRTTSRQTRRKMDRTPANPKQKARGDAAHFCLVSKFWKSGYPRSNNRLYTPSARPSLRGSCAPVMLPSALIQIAPGCPARGLCAGIGLIS